MSTEADIVGRISSAIRATAHCTGSFIPEDLVRELARDVSKIAREGMVAERDAAARGMRERCKAEARKIAVEMINSLATPPNVRGFLYDDSHLKYGHKVACCIENAIADLPDAVIATSGKDAT